MQGGPLGGALVALLIGLLLGLERQRSQAKEEPLFAGIRTFPLLTLAGYLGAFAQERAPLALPAVVLAVGALAIAAYLRTAGEHVGTTTEVLAILAPLLGAMVAWEEPMAAASLAVIITLLLTLKAPLHRIAGAISEAEVFAILKFGIVAVVLVPLLPEDPVGPYGAIVPRHVGIVVVVLSGVSLGGYLLVRVLGSHAGWSLAGLLGGLASSTAVTLSLAGKAREQPAIVRPLAVGIVLASTVLYGRSLLLAGLFDRSLGIFLLPRLGLLLALGAGLAALLYRRGATREREPVGLGNPVELGRAIALAVIFAAILVLARAAQEELGTGGLWAAGLLGGLIDVDSVTVAAARLRSQQLAELRAAAGSLLLATLSNLLLKAGVVWVVGGGALARQVLPAFAALAAATLGVLVLG